MTGHPQQVSETVASRATECNSTCWKAAGLLFFFFGGCSFGPDLPQLPARDELPIQSRVNRRYDDVLANPISAAANGDLGITLHTLFDNAHAEILYQRAFLLEPESFDWPYYIAVVQAAQDKYDSAVASLRHALLQESDYAPAKLLLAELALRMGGLLESEALADDLAGDPEAAPYGRYLLARIHRARDSHNAAAEACRRACDLFPTYGDAHELWARSALHLGDEAAAKTHFLLADRHRFQTPPLADPLLEKVHGGRIRPDHLLLEGLRAEEQGRLREAGEFYLNALSMDPRSTAAHARLIRIALERGERDQALEHYASTRRIGNQPADAHAHYGLLLFREDRFQEARAAFELALQINPYHPDALVYLGRLREQQQKLSDAEQLYRLAIECRPTFREARLSLGRLLIRGRRYEQAFAEFDKLLALTDEKTPEFLLEISALYTVAGKPAEALRCLRRAYDLAKQFGQLNLLDKIVRQGVTH